MKKLVLFFAVAFAMSFASCGNKAAESTLLQLTLLLLLNNLQLKQGKNWSYSRARDSSFYF